MNERAKKILNQGEQQYTDEEVKLIVDFLKKMAKLNCEIINHVLEEERAMKYSSEGK